MRSAGIAGVVKEETGMVKDEVNGNNNVGVYLNKSQES
jgi:hypothetical protein